jgi:hypothetical protein
MFKHIGRKIKVIAAIWGIVGIAASLAAGVLLYLGKTLDLLWCIVIAAGGIILSLVTMMLFYCIGDTHAKLERMEDKLIPKPSYASYLNDNQALRGSCEICGKTTDLINAKIVDQFGTRYRKVCKECYALNNCQPND